MLQDLILSLLDEQTYPPHRFGSLICTRLIDRSPYAKTRVLASRECQLCVEKVGLSAIGKRGIQIVAKALSEESLAENKGAYLDLVETVVSKMNGDLQKFARICASSLSDKAKDLVEERLARHSKMSSNTPSRNTPSRRQSASFNNLAAHQSSTSSSRKSMSTARPKVVSENVANSRPKQTDPNNHFESSIRSELPALNLKLDYSLDKSVDVSFHEANTGHKTNNGPFSFSYDSKTKTRSKLVEAQSSPNLKSWERRKNQRKLTEESEIKATALSNILEEEPSEIQQSVANKYVTSRKLTNTGAAATLRARLKEIKEKHKVSTTSGSAISEENPLPPRVSIDKRLNSSRLQPSKLENKGIDLNEGTFSNLMNDLKRLISTETPIMDDDRILTKSIDGLRKSHSALIPNTLQHSIEFMNLKADIQSNISPYIETLTR